jgi:hypothetical protein
MANAALASMPRTRPGRTPGGDLSDPLIQLQGEDYAAVIPGSELGRARDYADAEKAPATRRAYATDFAIFRPVVR